VVEAWSNFQYFNSLGSEVNIRTRPWEALVRDPWWIFTTWRLIDCIKKTYGFNLWTLVRINTRFGVMLFCMLLSIVFLLTDVVVSAAKITASSGINPYWRFALVFKCASDTIFLDDFKSVLDDIVARKFGSADGTVHRGSVAPSGLGRIGRKRSRSDDHRRDNFIECRPFDNPFQTTVRTSISSPPQPAAPRSKLLDAFSKKRKLVVPKIYVQRETDVDTHTREPSLTSWTSDTTALARPAHAVYASGNLKASESDGSLFNGRLV
jgi:hypothetical protein